MYLAGKIGNNFEVKEKKHALRALFFLLEKQPQLLSCEIG